MESAISLEALSSFSFSFSFIILLHQPRLLLSQQFYFNSKQLTCDDTTNDNFTKGFACNGLRNSCRCCVTFRSTPFYASLVSISYLLPTNHNLHDKNKKARQFIEDVTAIDEVQRRVLAEILCCNARVVRHHGLDGQTDRESFKKTMPVITYEDVRCSYCLGEKSLILCSHSISEFLTKYRTWWFSSGS